MATLNYITLRVPGILFNQIETIQKTPTFNVCKYKRQPGIIFRIPHELRPDQMVHCFIEHEVNFTNTLKTGTLTLKVQCTLVPVTHGVFSGFKNLEGHYDTDYTDEEDYSYGNERFVPNYNDSKNEIFVAPLPIGLKSNLYEYLNEILFQHCDDPDVLSKYAVSLGCQANTVRKATYIPSPEMHSKVKSYEARQKHIQAIDFFKAVGDAAIALLPEKNQLNLFGNG